MIYPPTTTSMISDLCSTRVSVLFSIQYSSVLFSDVQYYSVFFSIIQYYSAGSAFSIVSTYFNNLRASILRFGLRQVVLLLEPSRDSTSQIPVPGSSGYSGTTTGIAPSRLLTENAKLCFKCTFYAIPELYNLAVNSEQ